MKSRNRSLKKLKNWKDANHKGETQVEEKDSIFVDNCPHLSTLINSPLLDIVSHEVQIYHFSSFDHHNLSVFRQEAKVDPFERRQLEPITDRRMDG